MGKKQSMSWVKNQWMRLPHKGKFRKAIIKFVMKLTSNSRKTHHLKRYFQTGKISKQSASQVFRDRFLIDSNKKKISIELIC